ncbi:MAG TPA: beta-galactosidase, partial [Microbacterium sp.]|nr:beta-galactosidase [Microbacterium sp.]
AELDALLAAGASVNFYMFHGGTNFGLTNGANDKGRYLPIVTSYDYDAPLDERGDPTEKYFAFRDVIAKYAPVPDEVPAASGPAPVFDVALKRVEAGGAASVSRHEAPPTFEELGHLSALIAYETDLDGRGGVLRVGEVRDHAWVSVDGVSVGTLSRTRHEDALVVPAGRRLRVLVEEQGRVNYDVRLGEPKGLIGAVTLEGEPLTGWTATPIDVAALGASVRDAAAIVSPDAGVAPFVLRGAFALDEAADLFLDTKGWGKGFALVNGFLLGRYWSSGPQRTLYVPAAALNAGENVVVVVELDRVTEAEVRFVAEPDLGPLEE